jgi:hypothetical protein
MLYEFVAQDVSTNNDLLPMVTPLIEKEDSIKKNANPASQRLSAILPFWLLDKLLKIRNVQLQQHLKY